MASEKSVWRSGGRRGCHNLSEAYLPALLALGSATPRLSGTCDSLLLLPGELAMGACLSIGTNGVAQNAAVCGTLQLSTAALVSQTGQPPSGPTLAFAAENGRPPGAAPATPEGAGAVASEKKLVVRAKSSCCQLHPFRRCAAL